MDARTKELMDAVRRGDLRTAYTLVSRQVEPEIDLGLVLVQLADRHTFVGYFSTRVCPVRGPILVSRAARRAHYWGTNDGLDQLIEGPRDGTVLRDVRGGHEIPVTAVLFTMRVWPETADAWGIEDIDS